MKQHSDTAYKTTDHLGKNLIWSLLTVVAALSSLEVAAHPVSVTYEKTDAAIVVQQLAVQIARFEQNAQTKRVVVPADYMSVTSFENAVTRNSRQTLYETDYVTPIVSPSLRIRAPNV